MAATLRPTLDVVFKLLFGAEENRDLLVALLNAVLRPFQLIESVDVLNPEVKKEAPEDRGVVLDLHVLHADGSRTNVEMQVENRGATGKRALYHWARMYGGSIRRGDAYDDLLTCRVVFFAAFRFLPGRRLHSTFQVAEVHDGAALADALQVHVIELPNLRDSKTAADPQVVAWAHFFTAESDEERRRLGMGNPDIEKATEALDKLSRDPEAQEVARRREDQLRLYRMEMATARRLAEDEGRAAGHKAGLEAGHKAGRAEGLEVGHKAGLEVGHKAGLEVGHKAGLEAGRTEATRESIRALCGVIGLELSSERAQWLASAALSELEAVQAALVRDRTWPET